MHPEDSHAALAEAYHLTDLASQFRPLPDLTILVTDDPVAAIARAERRDKRILTEDQRSFVYTVSLLYEKLADANPMRWRVVDRRLMDEDQASKQIAEWISQAQPGCGMSSGGLKSLSGWCPVLRQGA
jgi:dTMP kinase